MPYLVYALLAALALVALQGSATAGSISYVPGGGAITVEDDDSNPTYTNVAKIQFDQDDGFSLSNSGSTVTVDLTAGSGTMRHVQEDDGVTTDLTDQITLDFGAGFDIAADGASEVDIDYDFTEIDTLTIGSGSGFTWTFDASGGTDTVVTFGDGTFALTTGTFDADLAASIVDAITEIDATLKSGADVTLVTGTKGSTDDCAKWNADGDLVSHGAACGGSSYWQQGGTPQVLSPVTATDHIGDAESPDDWEITDEGAITAESIGDISGTSLWSIDAAGDALVNSIGDSDATSLWNISTAGVGSFQSLTDEDGTPLWSVGTDGAANFDSVTTADQNPGGINRYRLYENETITTNDSTCAYSGVADEFVWVDADETDDATDLTICWGTSDYYIFPNVTTTPVADNLLMGTGARAATWQDISALTAEETPAAGDFLLLELAEGNLRKLDVDDLPAGSETNALESGTVTDIQDMEIVMGEGANDAAYLAVTACAADEKPEFTDASPNTFTCEAIGSLVDADVSDTLTASIIDLEDGTITDIADMEILIGEGASDADYLAVTACAADEKPEFTDGTPNTFTCEAIGSLVDADVSDTLTASIIDLEDGTITDIADMEILIGEGAGDADYLAVTACAADEKPEFADAAPNTFSCEAIGGLVSADISGLADVDLGGGGDNDFGDFSCTGAGDGCTIDSGVITTDETEAALETEVACIYIETPVTDEDLNSVWRAPVDVTITEIWCETDAGTSGLDLTNDDGSPTAVNGSDIPCDTDGEPDTSFAGDATLAQGHLLDVNVGTVASATRLSACWRYTVD